MTFFLPDFRHCIQDIKPELMVGLATVATLPALLLWLAPLVLKILLHATVSVIVQLLKRASYLMLFSCAVYLFTFKPSIDDMEAGCLTLGRSVIELTLEVITTLTTFVRN